MATSYRQEWGCYLTDEQRAAIPRRRDPYGVYSAAKNVPVIVCQTRAYAEKLAAEFGGVVVFRDVRTEVTYFPWHDV